MAQDIEELRNALREFAQARDWGQFHSPKNLAASLSIEAAEVLEHFQWLTDEQSRHLDEDTRQAVAMEIADVLIYLIQLADKLGIDPIQAARDKMLINARNYPADQPRGSIRKRSEP